MMSLMSKEAHLHITKSRNIPRPHIYVQKMYGEYSRFIFDEEAVLKNKGIWKKKVFKTTDSEKLHLEIGTGIGLHLAEKAKLHPNEYFVGIELKYKPLIQTIRRCLKVGSKNVRMVRYNATLIKNIFDEEEINDTYIYFPDPWPKRRQSKHRLIQPSFIKDLHSIQSVGSYLKIKTDSQEYFKYIQDVIHVSRLYQKIEQTQNLHLQEQKMSILTGFEKIFVKKNVPICFACYQRR